MPVVRTRPGEALEARRSVVTIWPVDRGKTTAARRDPQSQSSTRVRLHHAKHIVAYQSTRLSKVTFLDTHAMRLHRHRAAARRSPTRRAVVAADYGVMLRRRSRSRTAARPTCRSRRDHKIDLPEANPIASKSQAAQEGLQPEEWGGRRVSPRILRRDA